MKCKFGLWYVHLAPTAYVEIKNSTDEAIEYDFTNAAIVSGTLTSDRQSSSDARGRLRSGKKVHLEIEFEKMIGVRQLEWIGDKETTRWSTSPLTVRLGTLSLSDTVLVVPDLEFTDRY